MIHAIDHGHAGDLHEFRSNRMLPVLDILYAGMVVVVLLAFAYLMSAAISV